jgi:LDH2 family malate/lactate/ureidoglycolate dehydrogenase
VNDQVSLTLERAHEGAFEACLAHGCSEDQARAIADTVTAAERDNCKSHGLFRIPFYIRAIKSGRVSPQAVPTLSELAPAVVQVDGKNGFAPLALEMGAGPLASRTREQGIAALCLRNMFHISALWPEVERLAEQGLVAFAFTAAMSSVAPAGGIKPLYGTNPMAFAWPRVGRPPLVFDQASSACARGEIQLHLQAGKPLPQGWAIGPDGEPTTDPAVALEGAQLPFGGHKGAALALMVELLAGALIGDVFSYESKELDSAKTGAPKGGEFMIAIDPSRCVPETDRPAQLARAETLFAMILEQDGTRLPSDRRFEARQRTPNEGITIPRTLYDQLQAFKNG